MELLVHFVLPLLGEAAWTADQTASKISSRNQFLDEKPGHDRLSSPRIVGEEESQRLALQHVAVHGSDLMRQRVDDRRVNCQYWVKEMGETNALRFGYQPEESAIPVETPRAPYFNDLNTRFVVTI
jgi:hypothetical protein